MIRRTATILLVALASLTLACIDMSAPKGPASISQLQPPAWYVVRGDVMRDSTGQPARIGVLAYDGNGDLIPDAAAQFFIIDSAPAAHFDSSGVLVGDRLGTIRLLGQIGNLQTPIVPIAITVAPTTILASPAPDTVSAPLGKDSATSIGSSSLTVAVKGAGDTAVQGVFVRFKLTRTLESSSKDPAVYIGGSKKQPISRDSTDATGITRSAAVYVLTRKLADQGLVSGTKTDSVVVEASASYKGVPLAGSPVRLVVPVKVTISIK